MTLEQLRIFVGVAEREHMTQAAQALNVTQSAASAAIATLEAHHSVKLFNRVGRRIELTEAGRLLLREARAILARADEAVRALDDFSGLKRGTLKLIASHTIAGYWLPYHIAEFQAQHPGIAIELSIANTEGASSRIAEGAAELGFIEGRPDGADLIPSIVARDQMVLVSAQREKKIDKDWLRKARWIMREQGSGTRSTFEEALREGKIDPASLDIALTLPSNEAVRTAVEAGAGVAVLSALVVERAVKAGLLHQLSLSLPQRPFYGIRHKDRPLSRAAETLLALIAAREKQ